MSITGYLWNYFALRYLSLWVISFQSLKAGRVAFILGAKPRTRTSLNAALFHSWIIHTRLKMEKKIEVAICQPLKSFIYDGCVPNPKWLFLLDPSTKLLGLFISLCCGLGWQIVMARYLPRIPKINHSPPIFGRILFIIPFYIQYETGIGASSQMAISLSAKKRMRFTLRHLRRLPDFLLFYKNFFIYVHPSS